MDRGRELGMGLKSGFGRIISYRLTLGSKLSAQLEV